MLEEWLGEEGFGITSALLFSLLVSAFLAVKRFPYLQGSGFALAVGVGVGFLAFLSLSRIYLCTPPLPVRLGSLPA